MSDIEKLVTKKVDSTVERSLVGQRIGAYEILEQVGKGGMGVVYRAKDRSLDRDVALKVLLPSLATDPEFEKRFVREARAAAKLDHVNIVQTYTAGRFENTLFIAMQFVNGRTIQEIAKERKTFAPDEALAITRQAAEALQAAHAVGLVHRDIKPNNIMLDETGRVKVMDFGLMRSTTAAEPITQTGIFFGTPEYASPEQCETKNVDGRTDIYSLGAVLYEMLTGRMPHVAETPLALFKKISEETPLPVRGLNPKVSKDVARLVERMMAKKREDRYETCAQLVADIDAILAGNRPATGRAQAPKSAALAGAIAAGVVAVALVATLFLWRGNGTTGGSGDGAKTPQPVRLQNPLMVVFDFKNGTSEADAAWYEIALSDMLIASLAQRGGTRVPTRDQMLGKVKELTLGDKVTDANQKRLLGELGAHFYLAGKFYVKAQKVRVTLACYRAADNEPAFPPMSFEKLESEVFALVDEMAAAVTGGLERVAEPVPGSASKPAAPAADLAYAMLNTTRDARRDQDALRAEKEKLAPSTPPPAADPYAAPDAPAERKVAQAGNSRGKHDKGGNLAAVGSVERMKHWYANRQLAEKCGYEEDDVKVLVENLKEQFQLADEDAGQLQKGIEHFRRSVNDASEARKQGVKNLKEIVDYCCLECEAVNQRVPGECPHCKTPLAIRIQLKQQGVQQEKQQDKPQEKKE